MMARWARQAEEGETGGAALGTGAGVNKGGAKIL